MCKQIALLVVLVIFMFCGTDLSISHSDDMSSTNANTCPDSPTSEEYCSLRECSVVESPALKMETQALALVPYIEQNVLPIHKSHRQFEFLGKKLTILQDWGKLGVAAVVWDAATVLCEYLIKHKEIVSGRHVLELGAGTGLVGMVAALAGGIVTVTERADALPHLDKNIHSNMIESDEPIHVKILDWTQNYEHFSTNFDVILGADIIYIEDTFPDLLRTLVHFANEKSRIFLSCKIRYERDTKFLTMMKELFDINEVYFDIDRDIRIYSATRSK